jgi:hypothetical protein
MRAVLRAGVVLLSLAGSLPVRAQVVGQAIASVSEGATNNALNAPDGAGVSPDTFTTVHAIAQLAYTGAVQNQTLRYIYTGTFYADHSEADGQDHAIAWMLNATPTARMVLRAQATATYLSLTNADPLAPAGALNPQMVGGMTFTALPAGPARLYDLNAGATAIYTPSATQIWSDTVTSTAVRPITTNVARSFSVTNDVHFEHLWGRDALTLDFLQTYLDGTPAPVMGQPPPVSAQTGGLGVMAGWRRLFSPSVNGGAGAGVMVSEAFAAGSHPELAPIAQAFVRYQFGLATADATAAQTAQIVQYLAQYLITDSLTSRVFLPLDRLERFHLVGFGTAQHGSQLIGGSLYSAVDLLTADVGVTFKPLHYPLLAALDYAVEDQIGHALPMGVNAPATVAAFPNLHRQMVLLTLTGIWRTDTGLRPPP